MTVLGVAVLFLSAAGRAETLEVRGDNTVIVDCGDAYSVAYLQHSLVKYVTKAASADAYAIDAEPKPDRATSLDFPVVSRNDVPADKTAVYVGVIDRIPEGVLPADVIERVKAAKRGTVLVRREGNAVVCTRNVPDPWNPIPPTGPVNDRVYTGPGDVTLGGTLTLTAMTKLHPASDPENVEWYGEQTRIIISADIPASVSPGYSRPWADRHTPPCQRRR